MIQNSSKIRLPRLIGDNMIMQRNAQVRVWGWAPPGESIIVFFAGGTYHASADDTGIWNVTIQTENAGGSYEMTVRTEDGADEITVRNILLGDVWVCSGQSNMEMRMASVRNTYSDEIAGAGNDSVRQFLAPVKYDFTNRLNDFESGSWESVNPQSVLKFTAVGYFFAKKLYEKYKVPIGLINASLGGAPIESLMSEEALMPFSNFYQKAQKMKDKAYLDSIIENDRKNSVEWRRNIEENDIGKSGSDRFYDMDFDASGWESIRVPSLWADEGADRFNGAVWFRKEIEISAADINSQAVLFLGNIIDEDTVYINGVKIGFTPMQYAPRKYNVPENLLREGRNIIVIRVVNFSGKGGFYKGKPYHLEIGGNIIDLTGEWKYISGIKSRPVPQSTVIANQPAGLFNAMISPITGCAIKGVIWYQGESNLQRPEEYQSLLTAMIADWRNKWNLGDFPFLYVQLPNFGSPDGSGWAVLRECQRNTLAVPATGIAVTIDVGEGNDIHPKNKKDVGIRLALAAMKGAYGDRTVVSSPMCRSARKDGNRIIISFDDTGSGLCAKDGDILKYFEISGEDKVFVGAEANIEDDCVAVWSEHVTDPVHVRYAWADNPDGANLYNKEGLPASPFFITV